MNDATRVFVALAIIFGLAFAFVTPPFQVPDEIGHYWRAASIAYGEILPPTNSRGSFAELPDGMKLFVFVMQPRTPGAKIARDQFTTAIDVPLREERPVIASFPAGYTPVPYVPQIMAVLVGRALNLRPTVTFYLGRIFNIALFVALIAVAIRIAPVGKWIFCAVGLLPMAIYLAASWSPDAATIALAFLFTALLLRACSAGETAGQRPALHGVLPLAFVGALLGLSKPAYVLIALLAFLIPPRRFLVGTLVLLATLIGAGMSMANAARAHVPRQDAAVDPAAQQRCIIEQPLHFAQMAASHARQNAFEYTEQMIGRLGLLEIRLPLVIIWSDLLLLALAAFASGGKLPLTARLLSILLVAGTLAGIAVAFYVGYSRSCDVIEGIQGRYFLPVVPLLLLAISFPFSRDRTFALLTLAVGCVANSVGVFAVVCHYYY